MLFLAAIMLTALQALSGNVDLASAQRKASDFLQRSTQGRLMTSAPTVKWTHEVKNSSNAALVAFYIVNTDKGYVIVSGDDRGREVLAYSDSPLESINDLPEAVEYFLDIYQKQIEYLQAHPGIQVQKPINRGGTPVPPLLTSAWSQGKPYNMKTPKKGTGQDPYCKVGCSAVALAQVMYYWKYPEASPALPGYTCPTSGYVIEDLPEYTFDWDNMMDTYPTSNSGIDQLSDTKINAIAWLMRYVGQAETMDYGLSQSGAESDQIMDALRTFGYRDARLVMKWDFEDGTVNYTEEEWAALIQSELRIGRPLIYCAFDMSSDSTAIAGHAFNVDGYDADNDMYHVNFGMSADKNTYYALDNFTLDNGMTVYDFYPILFADVQNPGLTNEPRIYTSAQSLDLECYLGETVTATFNVSSANLTDGITVTVTDANDVFSVDVTSIPLAEVNDKTITVTYTPSEIGSQVGYITLSSEGAPDATVNIRGIGTEAPLVKYDPVMQPANCITSTSFRANWTDQTPAENVASYTLEVQTKPNINILAEADWSGVGQNYNNVASSASQYMPEGWTFSGTGMWLEGGFISIGSGSSISSPTFELSGTDKVTVVVNANNDGYSTSKFSVSTSLASQDITPASTTTQYVVVLDCAATDKVTFTGKSSYPGFVSIQIYAGEIDPPTDMRATETGDASYRLITGITDKYYTVNNLTADGTFLYKVKALYVDGTESAWSNVEEVTLGGSSLMLGDVDNDGEVGISDVSALIDYLLGNSTDINLANADVNSDDEVSIADVSDLIDILLGNI